MHPGAGLLKYRMRSGRQVRRRALSALREGRKPLSRVEPRINSSLGRDLFAILYCYKRRIRPKCLALTAASRLKQLGTVVK